jgi:hypothetical protein
MIVGEEEQDRRDLLRMCIQCPARISGLPDGAEVEGTVLDLSGSGLAIECGEEFAPGTNFRVTVVPDKPVFMPLVADVEVVRVEPREGGTAVYGLRICELLS